MMRYHPLVAVLIVFAGHLANPGATGRAAEQEGAWGAVKGQVVFGGTALPATRLINVTGQDKDHCLAKAGKLTEEDWVINPANKGVRWAFVWLIPEPGGAKTLPIHPSLKEIKVKQIEIDQPACKFEPHAIALREGQALVAKNSAAIVHNVNWAGRPLKNPGGNQLIPAGKSYVIEDLKADMIPVRVACNIHPWMKAWVGVFETPYSAVTDANGQFEIKLAPAGKCRLMVWQESVGWRDGKAGLSITINPDGTTDLGKLDLKPE